MSNTKHRRSDSCACRECWPYPGGAPDKPVTTTKHTPGPWYQDRAHTLRIWADDPATPNEAWLIADAALTGSVDTDNANARLIAAAPELLEACKAAFAKLEAWDIDWDRLHNDSAYKPEFSAETQALRAAIAKAEGR